MRAMFIRHRHQVDGVAFSPDGRSLVSACKDSSVRIWNIRDGSSKQLPVTNDAGSQVGKLQCNDSYGPPNDTLYPTHTVRANTTV